MYCKSIEESITNRIVSKIRSELAIIKAQEIVEKTMSLNIDELRSRSKLSNLVTGRILFTAIAFTTGARNIDIAVYLDRTKGAVCYLIKKGNERSKFDPNYKKIEEKINLKQNETMSIIDEIAAKAAQATMEKLLDEKLKPLQDKLSKYENESASRLRLESLQSKLASAPDLFKNKTLKDFGRMNFETEEEFAEYLAETETDLNTFNQVVSNTGLSRFSKPFQSAGDPPKTADSAVIAFLEERKDGGTGNLGGKELDVYTTSGKVINKISPADQLK